MLTVGNPTIPRHIIDATRKSNAGPVDKKSVLISRHTTTTRRCQQCHRDFFGDTCFQMHLVKDHAGKPASNPHSTICFHRRRCPSCRKQEVGPQALERHQCWYIDCPSCHEYVHGETHRCFIQRAPKPQEKKRKRKRQGGPRAKRGAAAGSNQMLPEEEEDVDDLPPLHVFFDIEAMQPHEQHIANLVVAETEDDDRPVRFLGEHCLRDFLEWLDTLTNNDTRQVNVLAHNFQGYDGYFVIHQYYGDNWIVEQLRNGCKLLEVQHDRIRFIDSLSFFQMPLSAFPKTFGTLQRLLPPQVQSSRTSKLRGTHPGPRLLHARNHVFRRQASLGKVASRATCQ